MMGELANYPDGPDAIMGRSERTTLAIVPHEVGHRWLSFIDVVSAGGRSDAPLGHLKVHWSFFMDSSAAFMYGEKLAPESAERFRTTVTWARFSSLDLYLMGLAPGAEGAREPGYEQSQKSFRQAWLLLHAAGAPPSAGQIGKLDAIRTAFESYIQDTTLGRANMSTSLGR